MGTETYLWYQGYLIGQARARAAVTFPGRNKRHSGPFGSCPRRSFDNSSRGRENRGIAPSHCPRSLGSEHSCLRDRRDPIQRNSRMRRTFAFRFLAYCALILVADPRLAFGARSEGIDVSHYQGTINWTSVAADGKVF